MHRDIDHGEARADDHDRLARNEIMRQRRRPGILEDGTLRELRVAQAPDGKDRSRDLMLASARKAQAEALSGRPQIGDHIGYDLEAQGAGGALERLGQEG